MESKLEAHDRSGGTSTFASERGAIFDAKNSSIRQIGGDCAAGSARAIEESALATVRAVMVKVVDVAPAGTVTLGGTVAMSVLLLDSATLAPPAGAVPSDGQHQDASEVNNEGDNTSEGHEILHAEMTGNPI